MTSRKPFVARSPTRGPLRWMSVFVAIVEPWTKSFVSPSFPVGPESVASLQRRNRQGGFTDVRRVRLRAAGEFSSYRLRERLTRSGVYRVVVPSSIFFSPGASVAVTLRVRRR